MKVYLKRTWQQPGTFKRWRNIPGAYEFPDSDLKHLPPDAVIEYADGSTKTVREARNQPPKPTISSAPSRAVDSSKK